MTPTWSMFATIPQEIETAKNHSMSRINIWFRMNKLAFRLKSWLVNAVQLGFHVALLNYLWSCAIPLNKTVTTFKSYNIVIFKSKRFQPIFQFIIFLFEILLLSDTFSLSFLPFSSSCTPFCCCLLFKGVIKMFTKVTVKISRSCSIKLVRDPGSLCFWNIVCSIDILCIFIFAALIAWIVPVILIGPSFLGMLIRAPVSNWILFKVVPPLPIIEP